MTTDTRFTYVRFMRDGSTEIRTGVANDPKRVRHGKTAKKRGRK